MPGQTPVKPKNCCHRKFLPSKDSETRVKHTTPEAPGPKQLSLKRLNLR